MATGDIDIGLLRAFAGVAAERSFTAAARRAGCSQATVSRRVRALEALLGVRLFERARPHARLTLAGWRLLPGAQALLARHDRLLAGRAPDPGTGAASCPRPRAGKPELRCREAPARRPGRRKKFIGSHL